MASEPFAGDVEPSPSSTSPLTAAALRLLGERRLILAANRGPVSFSAGADGTLRTRRGSGGVVTALSQVGEHVPVTWVAATMNDAERRAARNPEALARAMPTGRVRLRLASVERTVYMAAHNVIANPLLWFFQHEMWNLPERPMIDAATMRAWQHGYVPLNEAFAEAILREVARDDPEPRVMLHDYHLYLAATAIRRARPDAILSHFTHIPWPSSSLWLLLPPVIREGIVRGLLANDIVGFQTPRYAYNFLRSVETFVPAAHVDFLSRTVVHDGRPTRVRVYPISIDVAATRRVAASAAVRRRRVELQATSAERVLVRVDRLEPSKNILRGFRALEALLERHSELRGRISFLAFLVPSRTSIREYRDYGRKVYDETERINARFGRAGRVPVQIFFEHDYAQALAGLSIADVILVNPLIDGMNLVAKEAAVVNQRDGVLVLSETAGAYDQMADGVLPVAATDIVGTADALAAALAMPLAERRARLERLRAGVEREDISWWLQRQLEDLAWIVESRGTGEGRSAVRRRMTPRQSAGG
jgi:trehalose 6-phosphate synthase